MTTKKTVKKSTKKPSAKQIAARKKFAATAKARAKKSKTKTAKTWTTTPSGKRTRTATAKKARKAKNTVKGFYPNPIFYLVYAAKSPNGKKYYFSFDDFGNLDGEKLVTNKSKAYMWHKDDLIDSKIFFRRIVKKLPAGFNIYTEQRTGKISAGWEGKRDPK